MFVRYYVVRNVLAVVAVAGIGTAWASGAFDGPPPQQSRSKANVPVPVRTNAPRPEPKSAVPSTPPPAPVGLLAAPTTAPKAPGDDLGIAAAYTTTAEAMGRPTRGAKKLKDALKRTGAKVNIYNDDGDGRWDRAKVDVDRDDTWDGKLTRKNGAIELKLNDAVFVYRAGRWAKK